MKTFNLFALFAVLFVVGCATTLPPAYTLTTGTVNPIPSAHSELSLRMAPDLRTYNHPLTFFADGTVKPTSAIRYYAPLELAIERTLSDMTTFTATKHAVRRITVQDFCIDHRGVEPCVRVTLKEGTTRASVFKPLPTTATHDDARRLLGECLTEAYLTLSAKAK